MSLMRAHQQNFKETDKAVAVASNSSFCGKGSLNQQQLTQLLDGSLETDLKALSEIKSQDAKAKLKRDKLLPKYEDYVQRLMDMGWKHDLLPYIMLWAFDAGEIETGLEVGFHCIANDIGMPSDMFKSDIQTIMARGMASWAEDEIKAERTPEPYLSHLFAVLSGEDGGKGWDVTDKLTNRLYKSKALLAEQAGDLEAAQKYFQKACDLGASVKTKLDKVAKALAVAKEAEGGNAGGTN